MTFLLSRRRRRNSAVLFKYTPGDSLSLATFSRASTATYVDANGIVQTASTNVARDGHYIGGVRSLLLEGSRTNVVVQSGIATGWTATNVTLTPSSVTGPDGATSAALLVENTTATVQHTIAGPSVTSSVTTYTVSCFVKAAGRTWIGISGDSASGHFGGTYQFFQLTGAGVVGGSPTGTISASINAVGNGWYRCSYTIASAGGAGAPSVVLATGNGTISYTGDGVSGAAVWGMQIELGSFASSYIPTTSAAVTRSADRLYWPWAYTPGVLTAYFKMIDGGYDSGTPLFYEIGPLGSNGVPRDLVYRNGNVQAAGLLDMTAGQSSSSATATGYAVGNTLEGRATTSLTGQKQTGITVNGGAEQLAAAGSALVLNATFGTTPILSINSDGVGANVGFMALQSFKIAAAVQSLATMRGL